jgi:DDE superfamily endonuclease
MLIGKALPFVEEYVEELDRVLKECEQGRGLTAIQKGWLKFCIMGIIVSNSINWAKFERVGMKGYTKAALSWMFRKATIKWESLLYISVKMIIKKYGIVEGVLVADDSDRARSKSTKRIYGVHKQKDKASQGYVMGQTIVLLLLVSEKVTIPVGFSFYRPDPVLREWEKKEKELKKKSVAKVLRPSKPKRQEDYPTKQEIVIKLLKEFKTNHSQVKVKAIAADALYGTDDFIEQASKEFNKVQVISQIRSNQNIEFRKKKLNVEQYFNINLAVVKSIRIRGAKQIDALVSSARLYVEAHKKKRFIIAIKYQGEENYRYLVASDMSWRTIDIIEAYTLRWLVEVFFEDWKMYEGWGQLTKQPDYEGSSRGLILSLLLDHCLFFHPSQLARFENNLPAFTVGSLLRKVQMDSLFTVIQDIVFADNPVEKLQILSLSIESLFTFNTSSKHLLGKDISNLHPSASLSYRANQANFVPLAA